MPAEPVRPDVLVEEASGLPPAISGVPTSITAFVGRAARGPVGVPVTITSLRDFERTFGGVWRRSSLGPSVRDFFANGGSTAVIVRLYRPRPPARARAVLRAGTLVLEAASPGAWGNRLRVSILHGTSTSFHLVIHDDGTGVTEEFRDVVAAPANHRRHVTAVLRRESTLVRARSVGARRPAARVDVTVAQADRASDGRPLTAASFTAGGPTSGSGLYALDDAALLNLLVIPPYTAAGDVDATVVAAAADYCERRRAMLILDGPSAWSQSGSAGGASTAELGTDSPNAAVYVPRLRSDSPLSARAVAGAVAGVIARTDVAHGPWHAPSGLQASIAGTPAVALTTHDIEALTARGINCIREQHGAGTVVWGARTRQGADGVATEWRYVPVRRTALFLEESLARGTAWAVFEPNDEALWARLCTLVEGFLFGLFRQGAFAGARPQDSYFVHCGRDTTTPADLADGWVVIEVGFAPLKPAEFILLRLRVATAH